MMITIFRCSRASSRPSETNAEKIIIIFFFYSLQFIHTFSTTEEGSSATHVLLWLQSSEGISEGVVKGTRRVRRLHNRSVLSTEKLGMRRVTAGFSNGCGIIYLDRFAAPWPSVARQRNCRRWAPRTRRQRCWGSALALAQAPGPDTRRRRPGARVGPPVL